LENRFVQGKKTCLVIFAGILKEPFLLLPKRSGGRAGPGLMPGIIRKTLSSA
jgi:hypothetical protein